METRPWFLAAARRSVTPPMSISSMAPGRVQLGASMVLTNG